MVSQIPDVARSRAETELGFAAAPTLVRDDGEPAAGAARPRLSAAATLSSLAIAAALLVALAFAVPLEQAWIELGRCDLGLALLGMLAHYAAYPVRGLRWQRCVAHLQPAGSAGKFTLLVFFYNFIDNVVPAKLGDVYGAHLARINFGISRSAALGSIVFARMIDAWVILALGLAASFMLFADRLPASVAWTLGFGALLAVTLAGAMLALLLLERRWPGRVPELVRTVLLRFRTGMLPRRRELPVIAALTCLIWLLEILWIALLARAFGIALDAPQIVFLTAIPLLASAFPLTPSGLGVVEWTLFGSVTALGAAAPVAASLTLLNRVLDYWLHLALGLIVWGMRHRLGLRTWREAPGALADAPRGAALGAIQLTGRVR